jgi:hypothetical protein
MRINPKTFFSGVVAAGVICMATYMPAFSATQQSVVSARQFIGSFSASPKTELVASTAQRNFVVSASKAAQVLNTASEITLTEFPVAIGTDGVVELHRATPLVDGETVFTLNGTEPYTPPSIQIFRGKIQGEEKSKVVLTVIDGNITGMVQHEDGHRFIMSPAANSKKDAREHLLYNESAVTLPSTEREFQCFTTDDLLEDHGIHPKSKFTPQERTLSNDLLVVDLALDMDFGLFNRLNPDPETADPENVYRYVFPLIAMVSSIYEDEINVTFRITYFNVWTETDPYEAGGDISVMLDNFSKYWSSRRNGISRAIAHLVTGPGSTAVGGIAYRDQLCNKSRYGGYSVSGIRASYTYPTLNYSWDVNVIAHEIGHNFASPHTHMCGFWGPQPLDTCVSRKIQPVADDACYDFAPKKAVGSIMSYCHLINGVVPLTFTDPVIQVIREGAESAASCVKTPTAPIVIMQNPLGNQVVRANSKLDIRWTSARVSMVGLQYSSNNGQSWEPIVDALPATNRKYEWTVPTISSKEMLVRIFDITSQDVADTSMAVFEISSPTLTVAYPTGGERLAQQSKVTIRWNKALVETVAVDFSKDNGTTWETLQTGLTGSDYEWTINADPTTEGIIRVRDESNNQIVSQSQPFTVGVATIAVLSPTAGTEWLVNTDQEIRWSYDFLDKIRIEYSVDNGNKWDRIGAFAIDASLGKYTWKVPNQVTNNALIRIRNVSTNAATLEVQSPAFIITNVVSVGEESPVIASTFSLVPQPANEQVTIQYALQTPAQAVKITLQDVTGRSIAELQSPGLSVGNHSVNLATATLAQGVYFVVIEANGVTMTKPLTVMH